MVSTSCFRCLLQNVTHHDGILKRRVFLFVEHILQLLEPHQFQRTPAGVGAGGKLVDLALELGIADGNQALVYTTASIPHGRPRDMTLNLAAPIVISGATRLGKQIVLENEAYTMRHRVFAEETNRILDYAIFRQ